MSYIIRLRTILSRRAYTQLSPPETARFFLGKTLCVRGEGGSVIEAHICETEAYGGVEDAACHGYLNRRTKRTDVMFGIGGVAYIYLCYGLHRIFNIVTGPENSPEAVLVRSVKVISGRELVAERRLGVKEAEWANGPGKVCTAMNIQLMHCRGDLTEDDHIWIEDQGVYPDPSRVIATPRIGIKYAGPDWAEKPWRFVWLPSTSPLVGEGHPAASNCNKRIGLSGLS